jgi:hypothetical protein
MEGEMITNQEIKRIYGLRGARADYWPTLIEFGPLDLMMMDAPEAMPAGSMCFDARDQQERICERVTFRDGAPTWRQGGDLWRAGRMVHTAMPIHR